MRWAPPSAAASAASSDSTAASMRTVTRRKLPQARAKILIIIHRMALTFSKLRTPIGELVLTASDTALTGVYFPTSRRGPAPTARGVFRPHPHLVRVAARSPRLRIRTPGVERAAPDPLRHDHDLRR